MAETSAELIERVVRNHLGPIVTDVRIASSRDADGDKVVLVNVVFDNKGPLNTDLTLGVGRDVRRELFMHGDEAFPIISYTSKSDAAGQRPEAA